MSAWVKLQETARKRWDSTRAGKTRVTVQVSHSTVSVGAEDIARTLADALPDSAFLSVAGSDGADFDAPHVSVTSPDGQRADFARVDVETSRDIASQLPNALESDVKPDVSFIAGQHRIAMDGCGELDANEIDDYVIGGGYAGLARALTMGPEDVIEEVKTSGLRGRGGAYFPAGLKWEGARIVDREPRYLVVNAEEGEPGIFKDRHLIEGVPYRVLEGAIVAAYAADIHQGYIYVNAEANLSADRMQRAVAQAYENGLLGKNILDSGFEFDVEILRGAGGYVCGEETTLLNTMEGYRREPRIRPPFPTESGLWAQPTVINNVETLASVPFIMSAGAAEFAAIGVEGASGTKIISLSGSVRRPGIVEVPFGTTLDEVIGGLGGGPEDGHTLTAVAVGGPSSGVLPTSMFDTPIMPGQLHESGVILGAGGVIPLDERVGVVEVVRRLAAYNANESCGKCTPCREGTPKMVEAFDRLMSGKGSTDDLDELRYLAEVVGLASLCGLGQAAGGPVNSALHFFGDEMAMLAGAS